MNEITLSPIQAEAALKAEAWLKSRDKPFFYIGGYAGTGKTSIANKITQSVERRLFGTYTGKAASVLQKKGVPAETIHSLIYKPIPVNEQKMKDLYEKKKAAKNETEAKEIQDKIREELKPKFVLNDESPLRDCDLLVVDEVSMVGEEIAMDLLSFEVPILVLGDPGQLPPITGEGYFTANAPDVMLTEIHRQAAGNPIIGMATIARQGGRLKVGSYGSSKCVSRAQFNDQLYPSYDQVICGRNLTRKATNSRIRDFLGHVSASPAEGEKVICLKNNKELGILNGTQWLVHSCEDNGIYLSLALHKEGFAGGDKPINVDCHPFEVDFNDMPWYMRKRFEEFDFGYAITCHKSQGSQWPKVLIHNESWCFRENAQKWLYTALTRAEEEVMVVL